MLLASLAEAERLVAAERKALLQVAVGASVFLVVAFWILLGRILIRRVSALQVAMRAVEGGLLDVKAPGPAEGGDELSYLSRGFNRMLAQIRGFNAELTGKIEEATAELTRKNRDLAELNELLVEARRDLTSNERLAALGQLPAPSRTSWATRSTRSAATCSSWRAARTWPRRRRRRSRCCRAK